MDIVQNNDERQIFENYDNGSTTEDISLAEILKDESHQVITVVVFVISAVLVIILIFVLAVFLDCRQQKIQDTKIQRIKKRAKRKVHRVLPTLPTIGEVVKKDDERIIVESMEGESSTSPVCIV